MTTVLDILGTSTPVSETLADKIGFIKAGIACRIFFYQQLKNEVCSASIATLAKKLGLSSGTISTNIKWLRENGYIDVVGEHKSGNVTNKYVVTQKFYDSLEHSLDESEHSLDESNIQQMNGEEEVKEDIKDSLSKKENPPKQRKPKKQKQKPTPADIEYYNPLSQELLTVCSLAVPLVNGTKLDFTGVIKFLQANHATPDMVRNFGQWYEKTPNLKAITENWKLFIEGKQPRHKQFNGKGAYKNGNQPTPAKRSKYSDVI